MHPGVAVWCHVCSQIKKKTTLESVLPLGGPIHEKVTTMDPKLVPSGFQNPSKIDPRNDIVFDTVFGCLFDRFPVPLNLENYDFTLSE